MIFSTKECVHIYDECSVGEKELLKKDGAVRRTEVAHEWNSKHLRPSRGSGILRPAGTKWDENGALLGWNAEGN